MLLAAAGLTLSACDREPPLAPADGPQFLLGQSPLAPIYRPALDPATGIMLGGQIALTVEVTKGLTQVHANPDEDRFVLRTAVGFKDPGSGDPVATIDPKVDPVSAVDPKDGGLRQGNTVPFDIEVALSDAAWLAVLTRPGAVLAEVDIRLILNSASGERELDGVVTAGAVDPRDGGVLAPGAAPVLEAKDLGDGTVERRLLFEAHMPALLLDPAAADCGYASSAEFSLDGGSIALADPRPSPITGLVGPGDDVALVVIAMPVDDATWTAVDGATTKAGELVDVVVDARLFCKGPQGGDVEIDMLTLASTFDPKTDGVPAKDADDGSK
jgi:hypothetical protein